MQKSNNTFSYLFVLIKAVAQINHSNPYQKDLSVKCMDMNVNAKTREKSMKYKVKKVKEKEVMLLNVWYL